MLHHYFKIALRSIRRQKILSVINVLGLSIGIACFSLFLLFAVNEFNFDRFHKNAANIYEVYRWNDGYKDNEAGGSPYMPMPLGAAMKQEFPDVENYVRLKTTWGANFVRISESDTRRVNITYADPQFFSVFSFPLKYGNAGAALKNLNDIVITRAKATELFGSDNVIGRTVQIKIDEDFLPFTISAVAENIPANSSIKFDMLGSFIFLETSTSHKKGVNNWGRSGYLTYVQLRPGSGLPNDAVRLSNLYRKYYPEAEAKLRKSGVEWKGAVLPIRYGMQPIQQAHTNTRVAEGGVANTDPKTIWILLSIAAAVLLIACINFTTLSIGRSAGRAKEIGVRKVIGSERKQLIYQFLAESVIMSILSAIIGLLLAVLLLPYFNELSGRELQFSLAQYPEMLWMITGLVLLAGLLAGAYPALVLSGFKPVDVLKSKVRVGGSNLFTKSLVTVQFALSVGLIICTVIIMQQNKFMIGKYPGFNKENILVVDAEETKSKKIYPLFKEALDQRADIAGIANAELSLGAGMGWSQSGFEYKGKHKDVFEYFVDNNYINVMGIKVIAGRNFDATIAADSITSVVINETMMNDFGWNLQNAIGQQLTGYADSKTPVVIGVVKDFNFLSLKEKVQPQMFHQFSDYAPYKFFVKLKPGNPAPAIAAIQKTWAGLVPQLPLKYSFLDEDIEKFYASEKKTNDIIGMAGGISIFLACLGLFGLAALAAINRTKEIGIRKVLGAGITSIVQLLSKDFLKLIGIAVVVAAPLAWWFMHQWLQNFAYRINIGWMVFVFAGLFAAAIALITISFQAVKAGMANPVKSLRSE